MTLVGSSGADDGSGHRVDEGGEPAEPGEDQTEDDGGIGHDIGQDLVFEVDEGEGQREPGKDHHLDGHRVQAIEG